MTGIEKIRVNSSGGGYDVVFGASLEKAPEYFDLDRKVLIVTDRNVYPYAARLTKSLSEHRVLTLPAGEATKCERYLSKIWEECCDLGMTRTDCIVALGGGVVGDIAGFAAATYMRGIDFYNIPTTVLSQVDSSVGGKTAIDFGGYKNIVGAFHQPKGVLIDPAVLDTLDDRQYANGTAEIIKMAATLDKDLFGYMESADASRSFEVIKEAVGIKVKIVEQDEREAGLRRVLNFGHTVAHAIESKAGFGDVLHGEAVSVGMLPMAKGEAKDRIRRLLEKHGLPTKLPFTPHELTDAVFHDKKMSGGTLTCVVCPEIGKYEFVKMTPKEFERRVAEGTV